MLNRFSAEVSSDTGFKCTQNNIKPVRKSSQDCSINEIIKSMTVEEKIGQMTQLTLGYLLTEPHSGSTELDPKKFDDAINKFKVGSIIESTFSGALSLTQWRNVITKIQKFSLQTDKKIPVLFGVDSIHGANYVSGATLYPHNIAMAATRNISLMEQAAQVGAKETRASGVRWNFDPVLDLARNPLWPRFGETYGEDSYLVTEMGKAAIKGYEANDVSAHQSVATCLKHFVGYSCSDNGKDRTPASISDIELYDKHFPPFQAAIEQGAQSVMINSASLNGVPVHASYELLTKLLREKWGFKGLIVTDWEDIIRLYTRHKVAHSPRDAVKIAIEAGIDMSMVPDNFSFCQHLLDLVKTGEISEQRIDESVVRILQLKANLGLFDNPYPEESATENFGKKDYQQLALESAYQAITLLKNEESILPLKKSAKVLLAGPVSNSLSALNGPWSFSWQGRGDSNYPEHYQTLHSAFKKQLTDKLITLSLAEFGCDSHYNHQKLQSLAQEVDYIVLALGEDSYAESPGIIDDLTLPDEQLLLAQVAIATGKPVILVLAEGRPRIIRTIEPSIKGIIQAYWSGSKSGEAIVDVLFGECNPSGKLPYSYPRFTGDIVHYDRNYTCDVQELAAGEITDQGYKPQWPFGHGLSYSQFQYSSLVVERATTNSEHIYYVSVVVTNTGNCDGMHGVDMYVSDLVASVIPSVKRLKSFTKIFIEKKESVQVHFRLGKVDLSMINQQLERVIEAGEFQVSVGQLTANFVVETNEKLSAC